jgi:hypothetical protein
MTFRTPMFLAASLLLASHAAYASPTAASTDEVRALVAKRTPASPPLFTGSTIVVGSTSDEIRASLASQVPPSPPRSTASAIAVGSNTDEVRAAYGQAPAPLVVRSSVAAASTAAADGDARKVACQKSCACHHG